VVVVVVFVLNKQADWDELASAVLIIAYPFLLEVGIQGATLFT